MESKYLREPTDLEKKARIRDSLLNLEVMEGVLPTRPALSLETRSAMRAGGGIPTFNKDLGEAAREVRNEPEAMAAQIDEALDTETRQMGGTPASSLLVGTPELREQLAAFAGAGIGFYYADEEVIEMTLEERAARGGNTSVTRVLNQGERLLLETRNIVVKFMEEVPQDRLVALVAEKGLVPIEQEVVSGIHIFAVQGRTATEAALDLLERDEVAFAEPDFIEYIGTRHVPQDPQYPSQWHLPKMQCESAWDITRGEGINLVVIDNGFDVNHPDLASLGNISGWYRGTPDGQQADFVQGTNGMPDEDHGTACAGMAAGRADGKSGGVGVAFGAKLHVLACLSDQVGTQSTLAKAIGHAYINGSDIIACSLGPSSGAMWQMRQVLREAIEAAARNGRNGRGCPIFWATSNGNVPVGTDQVCSHPDVIAVGRSTQNDQDHGSAFGPQLEFLAPGVNVWIPSSGGGFQATTGTSFAAPAAAGVAALALSAKPTLTAQQLRDVLRTTCDKVGNLPYIHGRNVRFGFGRLNAFAAVTEARNGP